MTTKKTIDALTSDLQPSPKLAGPACRAARWIAIAVTFLVVSSLVEGWRGDWMARMVTIPFLAEILFTLLAGATAALAVFYLSVPDSRPRRWLVALAVAPFLIWLGLMAIFSFYLPDMLPTKILHEFTHHFEAWKLLAYGLLPGLLIFVMLKRAAPLHPGLTGLLAVVAITSLSAIACRLTCPVDDPLHVLVWHTLPVFLSGLLGVLLGKLFLKF